MVEYFLIKPRVFIYSSASEFVTVPFSYRTVSYRTVPYRTVPYRTVPFFVFVNREFGPDLKHDRTKITAVFRFIYFSRDVPYLNANS